MFGRQYMSCSSEEELDSETSSYPPTITTTTSLFLSYFPQLNTVIRYKDKIGEHWLPRITEKLIMMGSRLYIHLLPV